MDTCRIESSAIPMSMQDNGRAGWARFGVPAAGAMDDHAAEWANRLLENPLNAAVLEIPGSGARLRFLAEALVAVTGAKGKCPMWRTVHVKAGELLEIGELEAGLWTYVAVKGGFESAMQLGSASSYPRAGFGQLCRAGDVLCASKAELALPRAVSARLAPRTVQRDYSRPPALRVWRGPQWNLFAEAQRTRFFAQA